MLPLLGALIPAVTTVIDKLFPDAEEAEKIKLKALELQQQGAFEELKQLAQIDIAQAKVNEAEASSSDKYVARARPTTMWICNVGLFYNFIGNPTLNFIMNIVNEIARHYVMDYRPIGVPPMLDIEMAMLLLTGMLGLSSLRSAERKWGVARAIN